MNIIDYAILKKLLGKGGGGAGPTAYTVSSVDELPSDAVDGSMAIVDVPDAVLGTWVFNDTISMPNMVISGLTFTSNGDIYGAMVGYGSLSYTDSPANNSVAVYGENWADEGYKTIVITSKNAGTDYTPFVTWITANATKTEEGKIQVLYTHENGQWVYKCEVV